MEHTTGKWVISGGTNKKDDLYIWMVGDYFADHAIATIHGEIQEGAKANADRICRCVNNFDTLLAACELALKVYVSIPKNDVLNPELLVRLLNQLEQAIAAAESEV